MKSDNRKKTAGLVLFVMLLAGAASAQPPGFPKDAPTIPEPSGQPDREPPVPDRPPPAEPPVDITEGKGASAPGAPQAPPPAGAEQGAKGPLAPDEQVYLNVHDADIKDVIKQISKATTRNFIIDDKIKGKITIISERPMTREEAYQTFLSALEVAGYTTVKGPANVIKIVPLKDASKSPIPTHVDSTPYTDSFITRLISLDNISALEMSNAIKDLVSRDGNLFAYPATNTLIITDSGSNIDRIMKIVKELDQEGPQQVMEIIPIRNALAKDIANMVQELFDRERAAAGAAKGTAAKRRAGAQPEELEEVSRIIPDERTNSIIVLASKRAIENVRAIIAKLDSKLSGEEEGRIHVYYLKHAKAKELAEVLSSLTAAAGAKKEAGRGGADIAVAQFEGGMKITADETTNSIIVTALPKDFKTLIDKVVSKLDIPRRQVYFEAVVMELTLTKGLEYGASGYGGVRAGGSLIGMGQTLGAPSLFGSILGRAATGGTGAWPGILGGLISSRTQDITYVGADGTSETLTIPAFSAFLSALATRGEANIVSTPNILTLDNEEATMTVTTKEPTPGSTTFTSAATTATSVDYKEAGLELKIKPQISEGDMVVLEIEQKLSGFTTPQYSANLNAPAMKERKVKTTVVTENGQTVVMAGLMEDIASKSKRKIPLLGDIPILGMLFSTSETKASKSNMLIFITPHIIKDRTDFSNIIRRKIEERNAFIEANFSKARRKQIKDTIKIHREDLLEFKPEGEAGGTAEAVPPATPPPAPEAPPAPKAAKTPHPKAVPPSVEEPPPSAPVITVPAAPVIVLPPPVTEQPIEEKPAKKKPKPVEKAAKQPAEIAPPPPVDVSPPLVEEEPSLPPAPRTPPPQPAPEEPKVKEEAMKQKVDVEKAPPAKRQVPEISEGATEEEVQKIWKKPSPKSRNGERALEY